MQSNECSESRPGNDALLSAPKRLRKSSYRSQHLLIIFLQISRPLITHLHHIRLLLLLPLLPLPLAADSVPRGEDTPFTGGGGDDDVAGCGCCCCIVAAAMTADRKCAPANKVLGADDVIGVATLEMCG